MSGSDKTGFGKFVPGFDFLQNLAKDAGGNIAHMPNLGNWVAPTLNVEELDKRINELKSVHFWLEQNAKVLGATIQALEVQKMTLATLKGMNFSVGDMANAFKLKVADKVADTVQKTMDKPAEKPDAKPAAKKPQAKAAVPAGGLVDPLNLWGSLAQQFQNIAANTLKDVSQKAVSEMGRQTVSALSPKPAAKKPAAKKTAAKKSVR